MAKIIETETYEEWKRKKESAEDATPRKILETGPTVCLSEERQIYCNGIYVWRKKTKGQRPSFAILDSMPNHQKEKILKSYREARKES